MRERSVHGVAWRYVIGGAGEHALLLLPGYFVGAESWFAVQERLERSFRVLAVDYAAVETVSELASGLAAILAAEGIEAIHLVGQSVGALYAQELASGRDERRAQVDGTRRLSTTPPPADATPRSFVTPPPLDAARRSSTTPSQSDGPAVLRSQDAVSVAETESMLRVRSLVLVHGSLPRTADLARVRRGVALGRLAPAFLHRRQWARRVAAERPGDDPTSTFWRELFVERARRLSKRDVVAWGSCYQDLLARGELRSADFEPLRGRVLLVESPDDPIVGPAERSALRAFHAGAEVAVLEGAGHFAPERRPAELAAVIEAFVRAH